MESESTGQRKLCGYALIFTHFRFVSSLDLQERLGSQKDVEDLKQTFSNLGLHVCVYNDLTRKQIKRELEEYAQQKSLSEHDCLFVCVLTQGDLSGILYAYDEAYRTNEVWQPFVKCEALRGKPKVFIFLAGRGKETEKLVCPEDTKQDAVIKSYALPSLPNEPNFILAYSTVEYHKSMRNTLHGTWYINMLCHEINTRSEPRDLLQILTNVTRDVTNLRSDEHNDAQTPTFTSFLDKKFIIPAITDTKATEDEIKKLSDESKSVKKVSKAKLPSYECEGRGHAIILHAEQYVSTAMKFKEAAKMLRFEVELQNMESSEFNLQNYLIKKTMENMQDKFGLMVVILAPITKLPKKGLYEDAIIITDEKVPMQNIWMHFKGICCPNLASKPKIFFYLDPSSMIFGDETTGDPEVHCLPCARPEPSVIWKNEEKDKEYIDKDGTSTTDHADMLHFFGHGEEVVNSLLRELQNKQTDEVLTLCTKVLQQEDTGKGIRKCSYFLSTLRHPCVLSTVATIQVD